MTKYGFLLCHVPDKNAVHRDNVTPGVVITSQHGESLVVDYAVVTVPLAIMKRWRHRFYTSTTTEQATRN